MNMPTIVLEAHICDQRRSYQVVFEGPNAEDMALEFIKARKSTHAIGEWFVFNDLAQCDPYTGDYLGMRQVPASVQPYLINASTYPRLYAELNPICEHGMSAQLCYGPEHYCSPEEIARGW